jgi:hypothetical protein
MPLLLLLIGAAFLTASAEGQELIQDFRRYDWVTRTGERVVTIVSNATEEVSSNPGAPELAWRCVDETFRNLHWVHMRPPLLVLESGLTVRYLFDEQVPVYQEQWRQFETGLGAYITGTQAKSFTERALEASEVRLVFTDILRGEAISYRFLLRGLDEALRSMPCAT